MLLRLHHDQQIYLLSANHFLDYHAELNRCNIYEQLEHIHRLHAMHDQQQNHNSKQLTSFKIKDILRSDKKARGESKESNPTLETINRLRNSDSVRERNCDTRETNRRKGNIVRPWSTSPRLSPCPSVDTNLNNSDSLSEEEIDVEEIDNDNKEVSGNSSSFLSPLDALVEMSNKAFKGLQSLGRYRQWIIKPS